MLNLGLSFAAVFLVTCILLGFDIHTSFLILVCIFMITMNMFGVMYVWHIELNAISVVNIVMVGMMKFLSVEEIFVGFSPWELLWNSVHILRDILLSVKERIDWNVRKSPCPKWVVQ